ncbi:MAG: acyl-CoA dehydrogenase family protein, partial [Nocardioides sp.]
MDTAAVVAEIAAVLDGRHAEIRGRVRDELVPRAGMLAEVEELSRADYRERVREVLVETAGTGLTGLGFPTEYGGGGDIGASIAAFETLAMGDLSVLVKTGVQFGLFGGAILHLGTERHHDAYLSDVVAGRLLGCFAMTEHGHGSNVAELGTTATYDPETDEL